MNVAFTESSTRARLLAKARKLSARVTRRTIKAGITAEKLERDAREALRYVQRTIDNTHPMSR